LGCRLLTADFGLLVSGCLVVPANLLGAGGIVGAAIEGLELSLEAATDRALLRRHWLLKLLSEGGRQHGRGDQGDGGRE
jgi:hypothetical protein